MIPCGQPSKPTQDFGLNFGFRTDLTLELVYADTSCSSQRAAQRLALPVGAVDTHTCIPSTSSRISETAAIQNRGYASSIAAGSGCGGLLDLND